MRVRKILIPGLFCLSILLAAPANADMTYGFCGITNNNLGDVAIGEAQLNVTVSDLGLECRDLGVPGCVQIRERTNS